MPASILNILSNTYLVGSNWWSQPRGCYPSFIYNTASLDQCINLLVIRRIV